MARLDRCFCTKPESDHLFYSWSIILCLQVFRLHIGRSVWRKTAQNIAVSSVACQLNTNWFYSLKKLPKITPITVISRTTAGITHQQFWCSCIFTDTLLFNYYLFVQRDTLEHRLNWKFVCMAVTLRSKAFFCLGSGMVVAYFLLRKLAVISSNAKAANAILQWLLTQLTVIFMLAALLVSFHPVINVALQGCYFLCSWL